MSALPARPPARPEWLPPATYEQLVSAHARAAALMEGADRAESGYAVRRRYGDEPK